MKTVIVLFLFAAVVLAIYPNDRNEFVRWSSLNMKTYAADEMRARYAVWKKNVDYINEFNARNATFTVAMNKFGDLTGQQFAKYYSGLLASSSRKPAQIFAKAGLPDTFDWRQQGAVTQVKNQEQCGSCWSFSTTGSVEGCHFLATKSLASLSEQNLVDCSWNQGNEGCNGGLMTQAMDYIISNGGIDTEKSYPYTARDGSCTYQSSNSGSTLGSYNNVAPGDESALQNSVYQGPTSVAIDASHSSFQFYSSGVYSEPDCSSQQLDHGVLAIGWGTDGSQDYWLVKNSWGADWGQQGYIWMARNDNNMCGIATMATLALQCS